MDYGLNHRAEKIPFIMDGLLRFFLGTLLNLWQVPSLSQRLQLLASHFSSSVSHHGWPLRFFLGNQYWIRAVFEIWSPKQNDCKSGDGISVDICRNVLCNCHRQSGHSSGRPQKREDVAQQDHNMRLPLQCGQHGNLLPQQVDILEASWVFPALCHLFLLSDHHTFYWARVPVVQINNFPQNRMRTRKK